MWCVIVPTYNNEQTIKSVVTDILNYTREIIIVNDGSTDSTPLILQELGVKVITHPHNMGKGAALKSGFKYALQEGYSHAITIDADGQHFAKDIPLFVETMEQKSGALVVGCRNIEQENMPQKSSFANKFSNFWFTLYTGVKLPDTQTGYRLYPLKEMGRLNWITSRYEAELELLVYAAWHYIELMPLKVGVYYPPPQERVSHFRPFYDFGRISLLNTLLCILAVIYGYPSRAINWLKKRRDD